MFIKFARNKVEKVLSYNDVSKIIKIAGKDVQNRLLTKIASIPLIQTHPDDFIYLRNRSISALETYSANQNWDAFPSIELQTKYSTFLNCPVDVDHINEHENDVIGIVLDSTYIPKMLNRASQPYLIPFPEGDPEELLRLGKLMDGDRVVGDYIENLLAIDKKRANIRVPGLVEGILKGQIHDTSMGCSVAQSECSVCANKATQPSEFCEHILYGKGKQFPIQDKKGKIKYKVAYEINHGIDFFEDSVIISDEFAKMAGINALAGGEGADSRARILEKIAGSNGPSINDYVKKSYFFMNPTQDYYVEVGEKPSKVKEGEEKYQAELEKQLEENKKNLVLEDNKKVSYYDLYQIGYSNLSKKGKVDNFVDNVTSKVLGTDWYDVQPNGLSIASKIKLKSFYNEFLKKSLKEDLVALIRAILKENPQVGYNDIQAKVQKLGYKHEDIEEMLLFESHFGKINEDIQNNLNKQSISSSGQGGLGNLVQRNNEAMDSDKSNQTDFIGADDINEKGIKLTSSYMVEEHVEDHKKDNEMEKLAPEEKVNEIKAMLKTSDYKDPLKDKKTIHQGTGMESVAEDGILNKDESKIEEHKNKNVENYADHKPLQGDKKFYTEENGKVKHIKSLLKTSSYTIPIKNYTEWLNKIKEVTKGNYKLEPSIDDPDTVEIAMGPDLEGDHNKMNPDMGKGNTFNEVGYWNEEVQEGFVDDGGYITISKPVTSGVNPAIDEKREEQIENQKNFAFDNAQKILNKDLSEGNTELNIEDKIKETKSLLKISLEFSDGEKFDTSNKKLHVEKRKDGYYVVGNGLLIPVNSLEEGNTTIKNMQKTSNVPPIDDNKNVLDDKDEVEDDENLEKFEIPEDLKQTIEKEKTPIGNSQKWRTYTRPVPIDGGEKTLGELEQMWDNSPFDIDHPITELIEEYGKDYKVNLTFTKPDIGYIEDPQGKIKNEKGDTKIEFWGYPQSEKDNYDKPVSYNKETQGKLIKLFAVKALVDFGDNNIKEVSRKNIYHNGKIITDEIPQGTSVEIKTTDGSQVGQGAVENVSEMVTPEGQTQKVIQTQDGKSYSAEDYDISKISGLDLNFDDDNIPLKLSSIEIMAIQKEEEVPISLSSLGTLFEEEKKPVITPDLSGIDIFKESLNIEKEDSNAVKQAKYNLRQNGLSNKSNKEKFVHSSPSSSNIDEEGFWD